MSENATWVVLTDGYYIRIMYYLGQDIKLNAYRDEDFEQSSDLTYKLITRYRNKMIDADETHASKRRMNDPKYLFKLLGEFLSDKAKLNAFEKLVFVGPQEIIDKLGDYLPEEIYNMIAAKLAGDLLAFSQDKLETSLKSLISINN